MFEEEVRFCYKLLVFLGEIVFKMVDIILVVFLVWCSFVFLVELFQFIYGFLRGLSLYDKRNLFSFFCGLFDVMGLDLLL